MTKSSWIKLGRNYSYIDLVVEKCVNVNIYMGTPSKLCICMISCIFNIKLPYIFGGNMYLCLKISNYVEYFVKNIMHNFIHSFKDSSSAIVFFIILFYLFFFYFIFLYRKWLSIRLLFTIWKDTYSTEIVKYTDIIK